MNAPAPPDIVLVDKRESKGGRHIEYPGSPGKIAMCEQYPNTSDRRRDDAQDFTHWVIRTGHLCRDSAVIPATANRLDVAISE
jgi:hypothetical protein